MSWYSDLTSDLHLQAISDSFRSAVQSAAHVAASIPDVAANISGIVQKYPHMTPGVTLALGQAGYGPNDSITDSAAYLAAQRKLDQGIGWNSIGDNVNPTHTGGSGLLAIAGIGFPEAVANTLKGAAADAGKLLDDVGSATDVATKAIGRTVALASQSGGQLADSIMRNGFATTPTQAKSQLLQTGAGQSVKSVIAGNGMGIGSGFSPNGPATQAAANLSAASGTLTYADHPYFSLHGQQTPTPHNATTGRIVAKQILTPGSDLFSAVSGVIDAAKSFYLDPVAAALKPLGEAHAASSTFTPEDLGASHPDAAIPTIRDGNAPFTEANETLNPNYTPPTPTVTSASIQPSSVPGSSTAIPPPGLASPAPSAPTIHPADVGLIDGTRPSILPGVTAPWLNLDSHGINTVNNYAANPSAYDIFLRSGGMSGNITPELASQLATATTPDAVRGVLNNQLGIGLLDKPSNSLSITDRLDNIRMLQNLPDISPTDLSDSRATAQQFILNQRNAKAPTALTETYFNKLAAAQTVRERGLVLDEAQLALEHHIATTDLSGPTGTAKNFSRLAGAWADDADVWAQVTRDQIAMKTPIQSVLADGVSYPMGSPYLDQENFDEGGALRWYKFPDVRAIRQVTSTYGRLLAMSHLDVPYDALVSLQDMWRGLNIAKLATSARIIGEGQVNMAARGLDNMFTDPLDMIGLASGRDLSVDHLGNPIDFANDSNKFRRGQQTLADDPGNWQNDVRARNQQIIVNGQDTFNTAFANDIYNLHTDAVTSRLASDIPDPITNTQDWLRSSDPDAIAYRNRFNLTDDTINPFVNNAANTLQAKTSASPTLMQAVRTGEWQPGSPIFNIDSQGNQTLLTGFKNHINSLAEQGLLPDSTIGEITTPRARDAFNGAVQKTTDFMFRNLLQKPVDYLVSNPAYKQLYFANLGKTLPHMAEDVQAAVISSAEEQGLSKSGVQALRDIAAKRSGNLNSEEAILLTKTRAMNDMKDQFYDKFARKQFFDVARLITPFGNSWAQTLKQAAQLVVDRPQIIPRAEMLVNGAKSSGFFFPDPQSGAESIAIPGSTLITKLATGLPFQLTAPVSSIATYGKNILLPGFGPVVQYGADKIIPDKPAYDAVRSFISPFTAPSGAKDFIPSWANKLIGGLGSPKDTVTWANTVGDVMRYNASTGKYDLNTPQGQQKLEDDSLAMAKRLYIFKGLAQFTLPISPTTQDVVNDKNGQSTLTFAMTQRYIKLIDDDKANGTNLAASRFIDEFGMKNILGMQSMSQATGLAPTNQAGYDWMRDNPDIARTYPDIFSFFAPDDGGFSQQAYRALFQNGQRKVLTPQEALDAANSRVASMIYRNAKDAVGTKVNAAQSQWLSDVKSRLESQYSGWNPDYVGTKIPGEIRQLQQAAADPRLANNPVMPAIQAYLQVRDQAATASGVKGWAQASSTVATREYLRQVAAALIAKVPQFQQVYDGLLSHEMKDDATGAK